jgi:hypothetical protein
MAYDPQITVFDGRPVKKNLTGYLKATQVDALKWANDGAALDPIKDFHQSPRLVTRFPALTFVQMSHVSEYEDAIIVDLTLVLELALVHGKQDVLSSISPKYSMALESMLTNVPETTFGQDSIINPSIARAAMETVFEVQGKYKSQFIQVFQTRAAWRIIGSAY